jgi:hypothetical protein
MRPLNIMNNMLLSHCFEEAPRLPPFDPTLSIHADTANEHCGAQIEPVNVSTDGLDSIDSRLVDPGVPCLLLLPKELRLEIWKDVLTNQSGERPVLLITRRLEDANTSGKRFRNSLYKHTRCPEIQTYFRGGLDFFIGASLLRTNHLVYAEALPILYHSITFCPSDLQGIFPLFIENLSDFARSHMRYIRLDISRVYGHTLCTFTGPWLAPESRS